MQVLGVIGRCCWPAGFRSFDYGYIGGSLARSNVSCCISGLPKLISIMFYLNNSDGWQKAFVTTSAHASRFSTWVMSRFVFCSWRMLPPDQRRHALFSKTRMSGAKQLSFCGAGMHRSEAEGGFGAAEPAVMTRSEVALQSEVARGLRSSVCARALLIGVDKPATGQYVRK